MSYLHDKNKKNKKIKLTLVGFFLCGLVFFGSQEIKSFFAPAVSFASKTFYSLFSFEKRDKTKIYFLSKEKLYEENQELLRENLLLKNQEENKSLLESENQKLRNLFKNTETNTLTHVKRVGGQSLYGVVVLDRGEDFLLKEGDYLLGETGGVLGILKEVSPNSSKALLLYAPQGSSHTYFVPSTSLEFTGEGYSEGAVYAHIPHATNISIGDIVTLKNSPTLPVGKVAEIFSDEKDPFKKVLIRTQDTLKTSIFLYVSSPKN
jgi:cell shape-determining protein MreC